MNSVIEGQQEFLSRFSAMGMRMCNYYKNSIGFIKRERDYERERIEDEKSKKLTMEHSTKLLDNQRKL